MAHWGSALTRADAANFSAEILAEWDNVDRYYYTFLLNRIDRETAAGKVLIGKAQKLASTTGKSGNALRALMQHGEFVSGTTERTIVEAEL